MQSIDLGLNDEFDRYSYASDEDVGQMPENSDRVGDAENDDITANLSKLSKGATRKRISNPRIKLDVDKLKSSRGLPAIPKIFKNIHFKGKGHEIQDLELLMSTLEHWGHRLMPKMPFEELTERLEKLGAKKEVQTCIKRIRLDLPFFNGEVEEDNNDDDEAPSNVSNVFDNSATAFNNSVLNNSSTSFNNSTTVFNNSTIALNDSVSVPSFNHSKIDFPSTPVQSTSTNSSFILTDEQKERIERNRQLAIQKRLQRSLLSTLS